MGAIGCSLLKKAIAVVPDSTTLSDKLQNAEEHKPISITTLREINSGEWGTWNTGSPIDPFENDYSSACNYVILGGREWERDSYIEYRLYGKYSILSGTVATHIESEDGRISRLQIYADDVLIYTSADLGRKTDAIPFSVDVSGAEYIKIVVHTDYRAVSILSNVELWPA